MHPSRPAVLLGFGLFLLLGAGASELVRAETTAFSTHALGPDPIWCALGGARAATGEARAAGIGNPANAALLDRTSVSGSHLIWAGDLAREWAVVATPVGRSVGLTIDAGLLHGPALAGYDMDGFSTGAFQVNEWNAGASVGVRFADALTAGLGARYFRLEDPSDPLAGVGFSAGLRWGDETRALGVSAMDVGPAVESAQGERFDLPTAYRVGGEYTFGFTTAAIAVEMRGGGTLTHVGAQIHPRSWFALLGGVGSSSDGDVDWSTGVELVHEGLRFGYAVQPAGRLGATHQLGITVPLRGESTPLSAATAAEK